MTLTLLDGEREVTVPSAGLLLDRSALREATGWDLKAEGLCQGEVCVPGDLAGDGTSPVSLAEVAAALRRPLAMAQLGEDVVAVLGEPGGRSARTGQHAPELVLRDVDGNPVVIGSSGRKTVVAAWSTWCGCRYELPAWKELAAELKGIVDIVTVALDEDPEVVRPWTQEGLTTAVDPEHRLSDLLGVVQVPSTVWIDEDGRIAKPPTIAPGDDQFQEFTKIDASRHHDALRTWATTGAVGTYAEADDDESLRLARAERRLAAWLLRHGHRNQAEAHFEAAIALAPLDFSIRRASMPLRGQDPFGTEFFELWEQWQAGGRPGYQTT